MASRWAAPSSTRSDARWPGWSHSTMTGLRSIGCARPTRRWRRCIPGLRDFGPRCSIRRTRLPSGRSSALAAPAARGSAYALGSPSRLLPVESLPGLPADRIQQLHAVAATARDGKLEADQLRALPPDGARSKLQQLPGIGPFYSSLVLIRACGHADLPAPEEGHSRAAIQEAYGIDHELSEEELLTISNGWKPFRTWVTVMMRALAGRPPQ